MSKLSTKIKILIAVCALSIAVLIPIIVWSITRGNAPQPSSSVPQEESNSKSELEFEPVSEDSINVLVCGLDDAAGLTDVIMVVNFDVKSGKVNILQIPRDTYVGENYKTGKINQVYATHENEKEPIQGLIKVINEQMSLPIDHYATITLSAFRDIVDALGGVTIEIPQRMNYLPGKVLEKGQQHLDGEKAEWFVRFRSGYASGDIGRVNARELIIKALIQAVRDKGRAGMVMLATQNFTKIKTDIPLMQALSLANEAFKVKNEDIQLFTLEGIGKMYNGYAVYEAQKDKLIELLNQYFRPYSEQVNDISIAQVPAYVPPYNPSEESSQSEETDSSAESEAEGEQSEYEWEENSSDTQSDNQYNADDSVGDFPTD